MLGFYNYTVILTYMSLVSSVVGIGLAFDGNSFGAIVLLMISGLCDMFDGRVAQTLKRTTAEKKFGIQIDSLSDLVAFGVLPATIGYGVGLNEWWGMIIIATFVLAALIRLAYFNVLEEERQEKNSDRQKEYWGLPVTVVALIIPLVYAFKNLLKANFSFIYGLVLLIISFLFLFKFKIKKPSIREMIIMGLIGLTELLFLLELM